MSPDRLINIQIFIWLNRGHLRLKKSYSSLKYAEYMQCCAISKFVNGRRTPELLVRFYRAVLCRGSSDCRREQAATLPGREKGVCPSVKRVDCDNIYVLKYIELQNVAKQFG